MLHSESSPNPSIRMVSRWMLRSASAMSMPPGGSVRTCTPSLPVCRSRCRKESGLRICPSGLRDQASTLSRPISPAPIQAMKKLLLVNEQAPGDVVMLTAAVRDLHRCYPGRFLTDVHTMHPELWENNPYLTPLNPEDPDVRVIECHYPLIQESNRRPVHFVHGFIEDLNQQLGIQIEPTRIAGDIHLSEAERHAPSPLARIPGADRPYWIIAAGGKFDFTIKWWHFRRWQAVVNALKDRIQFVQVGE